MLADIVNLGDTAFIATSRSNVRSRREVDGAHSTGANGALDLVIAGNRSEQIGG